MSKRKSTECIDAPSPPKAPQPSTSGFRRCTRSTTNVEPAAAVEDYLFDSGSDEDVELDWCFSTTDSSKEESEESDEKSTLSESTSRLVEPGTWSSVQPISPSVPFTGNPGLITEMASKEPIDFFFYWPMTSYLIQFYAKRIFKGVNYHGPPLAPTRD